ncbi:MAG TPA: ATP-binding protein [Ruminococcus sp.]
MTKRIFHSISAVAIGVFVASIMLFLCMTYNYFSAVQHRQLKTQTDLTSQGVKNEGISYFDGLEIDDNYRITWIDSDGKVLYDSNSDTTEMENHLEREEIKAAFKNGYGESSRYSNTLMERSLYSARLLPDGTVLRLSTAQSSILMILLGMAQPIAVIAFIALGLSVFLASRLAKAIVKPLNELNLDEPLSNDNYDELSPLLNRIERQQKQIKAQYDELQRKQAEFNAVTSDMNEGIILLNKTGDILSLNKAAKKFFTFDTDCIGRNILELKHNLKIQKLIKKASDGAASEKKIHTEQGEYQLNASPVISEDEVSGIVLLLFDVTEKEKAELLRREFSANVSHELKTPLHTISGCSELMKNAMVRSEDIPKFSEQIYTEAQRMIALIEDIIKLSHLDEGAEDMKREKVDLHSIAEGVAISLADKANMADVTVDVTGSSAVLYGIPQLLHGIIYNLCDNAIKYNQQGGSVSIDTKTDVNSVILTVADTGIGIPEEHRKRIFERFYRVDKSHSRAVGGTGLGLSIVKHAASLHNANISVQSIVDGGTTVTVIFPINE